jgi:hypothetical protein
MLWGCSHEKLLLVRHSGGGQRQFLRFINTPKHSSGGPACAGTTVAAINAQITIPNPTLIIINILCFIEISS